MKYAYILRSGAPGTMMRLEYDPPIEEIFQVRIARDLVTEEEIAGLPPNQSLVLKENFGIGRVPIAFGYLALFMHVSPKMRDYIEGLEPGVHRFIPVRVLSLKPIDGKTDHGDYYILRPPPLIDCLVIEETSFANGYGIEGWKKGKDEIGGGGLSFNPDNRCTLRKRAVVGRHLWRTKVGTRTEFTVSDTFWEGVRHEPQSWGPHMKCVITDRFDETFH